MTARMNSIQDIVTNVAPKGVVVIDTETTGVTIGRDEILSVAITDQHGKALFDSLVRPERHKSWPAAERVNGIAPQMVRDAPRMSDISPLIQEYVDDNHLVVAYNAAFDLGMLVSLMAIPRYPRNVFDVMKEYVCLHGGGPMGSSRSWAKLVDCARHYGYSFTPHTALEDARATAFCFRALVEEHGIL